VPGMEAQGWPHRAEGEKEDAPSQPYVTASSRASARLVAVPLSMVPPFSFEGCDVEEVRE
jgi:hypothetical protein